MAEPKVIWRIYLVTCLPSGKQYVGITRLSVASRWSGHRRDARAGKQTVFARILRKYDEAAFVVLEVANAISRQDASELERILINDYGTFVPGGYNMTKGGDGGSLGRTPVFTETHRRRLSEAATGRRHTAEVRRVLGLLYRGAKQSAELVERRAASLRGHKHPPEFGAAISKRQQGRHVSATTRSKISQTQLGRKQSPELIEKRASLLRGRKRSEETKQKISTSHKKRWTAELRQATSDRMLRWYANPTNLQKMAAAKKATVTPEFRARMSEIAHSRNKERGNGGESEPS